VNSTLILWFVNTSANSFETNYRMRGGNATGDFMSVIEQSRLGCLILLGRWSRFSQQSSAAATRVYFERRCMKFSFREFSEGMHSSLLTHLSQFLPTFSIL